MAILIPSKNIYNKQNPKVRDNVIERIEIGAVEVVPDNNYETPVYNEEVNVLSTTNKETENDDLNYGSGGASGGGYQTKQLAVAYVAYNNQKVYNFNIEIPLLKENHYVQKLLLGEDKQGNANIKYSIYGRKKQGSATSNFGLTDLGASAGFGVTKNDIIYSDPSIVSTTIDLLSFNEELNVVHQKYSVRANAIAKLIDVGNLKDIKTSSIITKDEKEYYQISGQIMCSIREVVLTGDLLWNSASGNPMPTTVPVSGMYTLYEPTSIEITVYGNTIGIDLTDKTVYINGKTAKKVHSIDGNELMQTSNYYQSTDTNAIEKAFTETLNDYTKGKETATIRCSISDYYDYNSGDKVLSIDNSTGKMSFKMYDRVIPMVYGVGGNDNPMSSYQDGKGKVFQVLGSKIYYDGAVWQELSLQETYNSNYAINFSQANGVGNARFTGYGFEIQGVGKILINGVLAQEVNSSNESQVIKISNENGEYPSTADIEFVGRFSRIATIALSATSAGENAGTLNKIISYDNSQSRTYPYMFYYQSVGEKNVYFPSFIDIIAPYTFYYATSSYTLGLLTIPKHIKKIGENAFSMSRITSIKFLHSPEAHILLPMAGSETGMFYVKSARNMTIYTDNKMIKNYDWETDNITPTFYHLDGTTWE